MYIILCLWSIPTKAESSYQLGVVAQPIHNMHSYFGDASVCPALYMNSYHGEHTANRKTDKEVNGTKVPLTLVVDGYLALYTV